MPKPPPGPVCNTTLENSNVVETPLHPGGLSFHHIVVIVVAIMVALSFSISLWLMLQHATHYSHPRRQRQILRVLLIIPVYGITSLLITVLHHYYIYFLLISQLYEPLCIVSYLTLLLYLQFENMDDLQQWLRSRSAAKPWLFPLNLLYKITGRQKGPFRTPRRALTQFNIIWFCAYQYCVVRIICTIASVIAQATGRYCTSSLDPHFAHLWMMIIPAISTSFAMHTVIQAHWTLRHRLEHHHIHFKLLSIKLVVFFTFWQGIVFGVVTNKVADKISPMFSRVDIQVIIQYLVFSVELVFFALLHLKAYTVRPYVELHATGTPYVGGVLGWRAFRDCFNLADVARNVHQAFHWMFLEFKYRNLPDALDVQLSKPSSNHELRDGNFSSSYNTDINVPDSPTRPGSSNKAAHILGSAHGNGNDYPLFRQPTLSPAHSTEYGLRANPDAATVHEAAFGNAPPGKYPTPPSRSSNAGSRSRSLTSDPPISSVPGHHPIDTNVRLPLPVAEPGSFHHTRHNEKEGPMPRRN